MYKIKPTNLYFCIVSQLFVCKSMFLALKRVFLGIKHSTGLLVQTKKTFLAKSCSKLLTLFPSFSMKNVKN